MKLSDLKKGKYYKIKEYVFKVEDIHVQEGMAAFMVEISDWIGHIHSTSTYILNNGNKLSLFGYGSLSQIEELGDHQVIDHENTAILKTADLYKTDEVFALPLKMNNERKRMVNLITKLRVR